jgi:acetyl esterase/lipase
MAHENPGPVRSRPEAASTDGDFLSRLDPEIAPLVEKLPPVDLMDVARVRTTMDIRAQMEVGPLDVRPDVVARNVTIAGSDGVPVSMRVYRPAGGDGPLPCLYWIHGGGFVMGSIDSDDRLLQEMVHFAGCVAVSVEWRRAPEHPFPAALTDTHDGLEWLWSHADELMVDRRRIALGGASSGGGSAAALALLVRDRTEIDLCFQLLVYPMLDDRNQTASSFDLVDHRVWHREANILAWQYYLGSPEKAELPYAVPARTADLSGLPPTFISVGALDLFLDEDIEYASRLMRAGVPTELHVYPGAPHGVNKFGYPAAVARQLARDRDEALRRALHR